MEVDDPINAAIGDFGRWQFPIVSLLFAYQLPIGWHLLAVLFLAPKVSATCKSPNNNTDVCSEECKEFIYDKSTFVSTIIDEWDLICDRKYMADLSQMFVMVGVLVGSISFGVIADKYGRRIPIILTILLIITTGFATAFVRWFWLFCFLRFLNGVPLGGGMVTGFVIVMEIIGDKYREAIGISYQIPFWFGHLTLPLISYFIRDWRMYQITYSALTCCMLPAIFIVTESPRWLYSTGKIDKAAKILTKAAKKNNLPSENIKEKLQQAYKRMNAVGKGDGGNTKSTENVLNLFQSKNLRFRTIIICYQWFAAGFGFFGVAQYSGFIGGNVFTNVIAGAAFEIPATLLCVLLTKWWGRKPTMMLSNSFTGACMIIIACLPIEKTTATVWATAVLISIALAGMCMAFANIYIYSAEIFPTVVRNSGMGLAAMISRLASMIAPFVASIDSVWLSPFIFGIVTIIAAIGAIFLPETKGEPLSETFKEAELMGKNKS